MAHSLDIKLIELNRAKYINIKYYDQAPWTETLFDKGNESYGSSQDWFDNYLMLDNNFYSENPNIEENYIHMMARYGCGLIAISDLATYIAFNDPNIHLQELNLYDADKDCFKYADYMEYLFTMQKSFLYIGQLGIWILSSPQNI